MYYYQFNISDFALHTSHLTLEEEAVYRRLLDFYYDTESPIPKETQPVIRRLRLGSYPSQVDQILSEFFTLEADGWHNYRCDIEIKAYKNNVEKARENGRKGGRPRKDKGLKTQPVILANPEQTQTEPSQNLTKNYKPLTTNQELETNNQLKDTPGGDQSKPKPRQSKPESWKQFFKLYPDNKKGGSDATPWKKAKSMKLTNEDFDLILADVENRKKLCPSWYSTFAYGITKYLTERFWLTPIQAETAHGSVHTGFDQRDYESAATPIDQLSWMHD